MRVYLVLETDGGTTEWVFATRELAEAWVAAEQERLVGASAFWRTRQAYVVEEADVLSELPKVKRKGPP